jgi:NADH:ubiquinone oxidoreductase subunit D
LSGEKSKRITPIIGYFHNNFFKNIKKKSFHTGVDKEVVVGQT